MTSISALIFSVFGLIIGSFLNVVIFRFNTGKTFGGRSKCLNCHKTLSPFELIPVFSFLFLRGRCKSCQTRISIQYPLVELATGLVFLGLFLKFQNIFYIDTVAFSIAFAFYAALFCLLVSIAAYDLRHKIIPDTFVLFFGILSLASLFLFDNFIFSPHLPSIWEILSGIFFALPFAILWLVSKGTWMGLGDAKLALGLGWLLSVSEMFSALSVAFWAGALVGLALIFLKKIHGLKSEIPLAPFLVLGAILAFLFGFNIYDFAF